MEVDDCSVVGIAGLEQWRDVSSGLADEVVKKEVGTYFWGGGCSCNGRAETHCAADKKVATVSPETKGRPQVEEACQAAGSVGMASEKAAGTKDAIMSGAGKAKENILEAADTTQKTVGGCGENVADAAERTYEGVKQKVGEAYESAKGAMSESADLAGRTYDGAKQKVGDAYASTKDTVSGSVDNAGRAYKGAKQKVGEAYDNVKKTMTGNAKVNYEAAISY